ncbi:peptidylprolyl isomerase [Primorskyibacter sp. S87]|uniref:peptidylprolyl isomerase n=1 Tax=Primorskyibacter sp. S87 TaxID=3415126 RepID=UPI003C797E88
MPKGLTFLAPLAFAVAVAMPAVAADKPNADTVLARVNGDEITLGHLIVARASLPQQYQELPADVLYDAILDQLIQQTALKQSLPDEAPRHIALTLENERRSMLAASAMEGIIAEVVTDEAIQAAYNEKFADGVEGFEYNASHILVETEDEAKAIQADLENGADFAETAKEKSTGPSGPSGGELGWFGEGSMVPEFQAAVMELETGQISAPVKTQFGWHIIILNDKKKAEAPSLDEVRGTIEEDLRKTAIADRVAELTTAAEIERPEIEGFTPELLQQIDLVME